MLMGNRAREKGQGMTAYLIIVALIAISAIAVFSLFGKVLRDQTAGVTNELAGKNGKSYGIQWAQRYAKNAGNVAKEKKAMGDYGSYNDYSKVGGN
ncbi:Flp family type IVb pilin [Acidithiobacillus sp. M4-SHS-6]|uniref:Flp family type IVb pilin n=1 Tax=Acidithiobacillus sp. M4-SHS-6 TaxID=3383024 RepID=UPI0039BDB47D